MACLMNRFVFAEDHNQRNQVSPMVFEEFAEGINRSSTGSLLQKRKPNIFTSEC